MACHSCQSSALPSNANDSTTTPAGTRESGLKGGVVALAGSDTQPPPSGLAADEDSDSGGDLGDKNQGSSGRSRQKKFLKAFKQLPPEEVVLQRKFQHFCAPILMGVCKSSPYCNLATLCQGSHTWTQIREGPE